MDVRSGVSDQRVLRKHPTPREERERERTSFAATNSMMSSRALRSLVQRTRRERDAKGLEACGHRIPLRHIGRYQGQNRGRHLSID